MQKKLENKSISDGIIEIELCFDVPSRKSFYFKIKKDNNYIGNCGLRLEDTFDNIYLGNIEYEIFEEYRGNGYAEAATRLLGKLAYDMRVNKLNITARPDNHASIRTIEKLGARFIKVVDVPKKLALYKKSPYVAIYSWTLKGEKRI